MSVSDVKDKLTEIRHAVNRMMKDRRYKKAGKFMEWQNAYSFEIIKCAGELRKCREELSLVISDTAQAIRKGRSEVRDVSLQEKELENAVLGYLAVDDAIYALQSVNNYDAVNDVYEIINMAAGRLYGERPKKKMGTLFRHPERDDFKMHLESDDMQDTRMTVYSEIKDDLIASGDIEMCLKQHRQDKLTSAESKSVARRHETDSINSTPTVPAAVLEDDDTKRAKIEMDKSISFNTAPPKV